MYAAIVFLPLLATLTDHYGWRIALVVAWLCLSVNLLQNETGYPLVGTAFLVALDGVTFDPAIIRRSMEFGWPLLLNGVLLASKFLRHRGTDAFGRALHSREFVGEVGNKLSGGIGGSRGPYVSNQIQQWAVLFVSNRTDDWRCARGDGADHALFRERQQIFGRSAAARDHNDVD